MIQTAECDMGLVHELLVSVGRGTCDVGALQTEMLKYDQAECPVVHRFGPGIYIREVSMPAGTLAVGHRQKTEHLNILLKGRVIVLTEEGAVQELVAPLIYVGKPGQKVGYVAEDMVWQNIYATDETDIETLERMFLDKSEIPPIPTEPKSEDEADYKKVLEEYGVTEEFARGESERADNMVPLPHGSYKIKVGDSAIEGRGLIATADILEGEYIAPMRIGSDRTIAGRYTNHSINPNSRPMLGPDGIHLVATRNIAGCRGGRDGEEITINYRESLELAIFLNRRDICRQLLPQ